MDTCNHNYELKRFSHRVHRVTLRFRQHLSPQSDHAVWGVHRVFASEQAYKFISKRVCGFTSEQVTCSNKHSV